MAKTAESRFVIHTPNQEFTGYRAGVLFDRGVAIVTDPAKRDVLVGDLHYIEVKPENES